MSTAKLNRLKKKLTKIKTGSAPYQDLIDHVKSEMNVPFLVAEQYVNTVTRALLKRLFSLKDRVYNIVKEERLDKGKPRKARFNNAISIAGFGNFLLIHAGEKYARYKDQLVVTLKYIPDNPVTDQELIEEVAYKNTIIKDEANRLIELIFTYIKNTVKEYAWVKFNNFGRFQFRIRQPRLIKSGIAHIGEIKTEPKENIFFQFEHTVDYTKL